MPDSIFAADDTLTGRQLAAAQFQDALDAGLDIRAPWRAISSRNTWTMEHFKVIGQPDVTWDWMPVNPEWREAFGEHTRSVNHELVTSLVWRGPEWPWEDIDAKAAEAKGVKVAA